MSEDTVWRRSTPKVLSKVLQHNLALFFNVLTICQVRTYTEHFAVMWAWSIREYYVTIAIHVGPLGISEIVTIFTQPFSLSGGTPTDITPLPDFTQKLHVLCLTVTARPSQSLDLCYSSCPKSGVYGAYTY